MYEIEILGGDSLNQEPDKNATPILDMVSVSNNHERGQDPGVLSYISHILICHPKG